MTGKIPQSRILIYLIGLGLIPLIFVGLNFMNKRDQLNLLEMRIQSAQQSVLEYEQKQSINMAVREHFRDADHFYIDKHLETMQFLEPEIQSLSQVIDNKNFAGDESINKRLTFLKGPENQLLFSEGSIQITDLFQESTETLVHPVEINTKDLKRVLTLIEGTTIGPYTPAPNRPQLIILDFSLNKKRANNHNEVYLMNMKLLKREFL